MLIGQGPSWGSQAFPTVGRFGDKILNMDSRLSRP